MEKLQDLDLIDLYEEIGKNLEIKEILDWIRKKEEKRLKSLYEKMEELKDKSARKSIFEELEKVKFSDDIQKEIKIKKIENEILLEKEKEVDEKAESKVEDIELEELFSMVDRLNLDFNKRYLILNKIKQDIDLSKKSGKFIDVEKIKTFIEKQEDNSSSENWGDEKLDNLEEMRKNRKISFKKYLEFKEKAKEIGASKKGIFSAERKSFDYELNKATIKRKIIKTLIAIGVTATIFFILWGIVF